MGFRLTLAVTALLTCSTASMAQTCTCSGNDQVKDPDLAPALAGKTVCVPNAGGWEWQEQHRGAGTSGELFDFKRGTNPADPTEKVGTWLVGGNGANSTVTHTYLGGSSYVYKVCRVGTSTSFGFCPVAGGATIMATIKASIGGCP